MYQRSQLDNQSGPTGERVFVIGPGESPVTCNEVNRLWNSRRSRRDHFPVSLFAEPAWDMLLHLYAKELAGQRTSVTQLIRASNAPVATALRWIGHLLEFGLCHKRPDQTDRRRQFVSLTSAGMQAMNDYFADLRASEFNADIARVA